eukprot:gene17189-18919_t
MARKDCPAFNKTCNNCGIKGHFQAVCRKRLNTTFRSNAATKEEVEEPPSVASANLQGDFRLAPYTTGGRSHQPNPPHLTWSGKNNLLVPNDQNRHQMYILK